MAAISLALSGSVLIVSIIITVIILLPSYDCIFSVHVIIIINFVCLSKQYHRDPKAI